MGSFLLPPFSPIVAIPTVLELNWLTEGARWKWELLRECSVGQEWKVEEAGKSGRSLLAVVGSYLSATCFMELHPLGNFVCCDQYLRACASLEKSPFAFVLNYN